MQKTSGNSGLNSALRKLDFWINRTYDGGMQRYLELPGYPPLAILFLVPALLFVIYGPTLGMRGLLAAVLLVASSAVVLVAGRWLTQVVRLHWLVAAVMMGVAMAVYFVSDPQAREADSGLYQHLLLPIGLFLTVFVVVVPPLLARGLVNSYRKKYVSRWPAGLSKALRRAELFVQPSPPPLSLSRFLTSVFPTLFHHLFALLFFPCLVALLVPYPWMKVLFYVALGVTLVVFSLGGIDPRLNAMLDLTARAFFLGGQLLVSLLLIGLALGRLLDFSYVAIMLNSASSRIIVFYFAAAYSTLWLYESWIHFVLCERLLPLLGVHLGPTAARVPYPIMARFVTTDALPAGRQIQIHGTRFIVVGQFRRGPELVECFETYEKADLFDAVVRRAYPHADPAKVERVFGLDDLRQRILTYFAILNLLLLALCGLTWYGLHRLPVEPELKESTPVQEPSFDLRKELFKNDRPAQPNGKHRVLLVAASGGGTRAALYSASLLQGLGELQTLGDVKLLSGVSGGSAAIAYFSLHHNELVNAGKPDAWQAYADVMAAPFIEDVLRGASELRIAKGYRLGTLLDESFRRRMDPNRFANPRGLGSSGVGLIFNTTLAGISNLQENGWGPATSAGAGGRVLITNVQFKEAFPSKGYERFAEGEFLVHRLVRHPNSAMTTAAALSANFPPVFSNALVETPTERLWVTDGGASDNRGVVSALYVLKDALVRERSARANKESPHQLVPEIHVIIAEASGFTMDYTQDRGIGSTFGAAEKYASQLMVEVMRDIESEYLALGGDKNDLNLHYVPMPLVFRARGGVGTHWMLGAYVTLTDSNPDLAQAQTVTLAGDTVKHLIMDLHRVTSAPTATGHNESEKNALQDVRTWIQRDTHHQAWERIVTRMKKN